MKSSWIVLCLFNFILGSQLNAKTLFLAHFDKGPEPAIAANPDVSTKGEVKISPEGKWGGALDASYSGEWDWSLYYEGLDNYSPLKGTLEMWVKPKWKPGEDRYSVLINIHGQSTFQKSGFLLFQYLKQNYLTFLVYNKTPESPWTLASKALDWEPNSWHHVAATWDADRRVSNLFFDGQLAGQNNKAVFGTEVADRIYVGCQLGSQFTAGALIDELRISDEILYENSFEVPTQPFSK